MGSVFGYGRWSPRYGSMPSSVILNHAYFPAESRLEILFTSGARYSYYGVPAEIAEGMAAAFSKGEFFNTAIRNHYFFRRETLPPEAKKA